MLQSYAHYTSFANAAASRHLHNSPRILQDARYLILKNSRTIIYMNLKPQVSLLNPPPEIMKHPSPPKTFPCKKQTFTSRGQHHLRKEHSSDLQQTHELSRHGVHNQEPPAYGHAPSSAFRTRLPKTSSTACTQAKIDPKTASNVSFPYATSPA